MKKTWTRRSKSDRWLIFGIAAVLGVAALFYTYPATPGRAFKKNALPTQTTGATDYKATPDDLLW